MAGKIVLIAGWLAFVGTLALGSPAESKKVAVSGQPRAAEDFVSRVVQPGGWEAERFSGTPIPIDRLGEFRAVVFAERDEEALKAGSAWSPNDLPALKNYVESGGILVFCRYGLSTVLPERNLGTFAELTGFANYPDGRESGEIAWTAASGKWAGKTGGENLSEPPRDWLASTNPTARGMVSAQEIAVYLDRSSSETRGFITVHRIGKGAVYFFGTSLEALARNNASETARTQLAEILRTALAVPP
jgi:hypothetical protein